MTDPVAYAGDGTQLACGDGPELLVYRGDGTPSYKVFTDGMLVGLGLSVDRLVTVDDRCVVGFRRRGDGELFAEVPLNGGTPRGMAVSVDGAVAVFTDVGVWVVRDHVQPVHVPIQWVSALAWGPDGNSLGVGTRSGAFAAVDPHTGVAWGTVQTGEAVSGVAWSRLGAWVVASGDRLRVVAGDGTEVQREVSAPGPLQALAVSFDGAVAAVVEGPRVQIFDLVSLGSLGFLEFRRELGALTFGPGFWLVVGLDDGDATLVELLHGSLSRTEPHPGRSRNVWAMDNRVERDALRGLVARRLAGGEPIAKWVRPKEDEKKSEGSGCLASAAGVGCFTLSGILLCSGVLGLIVYGQRVGWW